jgi:hypothetical protein
MLIQKRRTADRYSPVLLMKEGKVFLLFLVMAVRVSVPIPVPVRLGGAVGHGVMRVTRIFVPSFMLSVVASRLDHQARSEIEQENCNKH